MNCLGNKSKIIYLSLILISIAIVITILMINRKESSEKIISSPSLETKQNEIKQKEIMKWNNPPEMVINVNSNYTALIETTKGNIKIELFTQENPITVNNFVFLAQQGFYDEIIFHRVINNFMIQGGCPYGTGMGGAGYVIPGEFRKENKNNRGTISMANAGPNTGGSQFFINLVDNNFLDDKHPAFGRVVEGIEIVDIIGNITTDRRDRPTENIVIKNIEIIEE